MAGTVVAREVHVQELAVVLPSHLEAVLIQRMGLDLAHELCPFTFVHLHVLQELFDVDIPCKG